MNGVISLEGFNPAFECAGDNAPLLRKKSLTDAEAFKDTIRDILAHGASGHLAQRRHGGLDIDQHGVGRHALTERGERGVERFSGAQDGVGLPLLGIVPEDSSVTLAAAAGTALALYTGKGAARACLNIARRLCGRKMPLLRF